MWVSKKLFEHSEAPIPKCTNSPVRNMAPNRTANWVRISICTKGIYCLEIGTDCYSTELLLEQKGMLLCIFKTNFT